MFRDRETGIFFVFGRILAEITERPIEYKTLVLEDFSVEVVFESVMSPRVLLQHISWLQRSHWLKVSTRTGFTSASRSYYLTNSECGDVRGGFPRRTSGLPRLHADIVV